LDITMEKPYYQEKFFKKLSKLFTTSVVVKTPGNEDVKYFDKSKLKDNPEIKSNISPAVYRLGAEPDSSNRFGFYLPKLELYREYECLAGETIIPLPGGRKISLVELSKLYPDKENVFYVYSYDHTENCIKLGKAHSVRKTKTELTYKITFDNGEYLLATENHPFLMRNGEYRQVKDLRVNDSLMGSLLVNINIQSIEPYQVLDVYDMTVDEYHNFATTNVFVHNSMDADSILSSALDIYADECTTRNEYGEILSISSENEQIVESLENLHYDILDIEFNLWWWVRNVVKYGDFYLKLDITDSIGITGAIPLSQYCIQRKEDAVTGEVTFSYNPGALNTKYFGRAAAATELYDYEVIHFRMLTDSNYFPYGRSILESARTAWKQLQLLEDAMLIHRITRAPDKRVFYLDIGGIEPDKVDPYVQEVVRKMKRMPYINEQTGQYNLRYNISNLLEDLFIPVRGNESGNRVETLQGLGYDGVIDDVEYIKKRMIAALKIPKAFLGWDEGLSNKCIHPQTRIYMTDGTYKTAANLISEYQNNSVNYVFSYNTELNIYEIKKIIWAGYTVLNAEVIKLVFSNDKYIICTLDHKFLTNNNKWVEAKDLRYGQVLKSATIDKNGILLEKLYTVKNIEFPNIKYNTCDIEVEDNHNFLTEAGIVIHNSTLSVQDIRFSRTVERVQRIIEAQLTKISMIHLLAQGFPVEDILNFELKLTTSSAIADLEKLEVLDKMAAVAQSVKQLEIMPNTWIWKNIYKMSDTEIEDTKLELLQDNIYTYKLEQAKQSGEYMKSDEQTAEEDEGSEELPGEETEGETGAEETGEESFDIGNATSGDEFPTEPSKEEPVASEEGEKSESPRAPKKKKGQPAEDEIDKTIKDLSRTETPTISKRKPKGRSRV